MSIIVSFSILSNITFHTNHTNITAISLSISWEILTQHLPRGAHPFMAGVKHIHPQSIQAPADPTNTLIRRPSTISNMNRCLLSGKTSLSKHNGWKHLYPSWDSGDLADRWPSLDMAAAS